ncbi:MAG: hypothetical protein ABII23_01130 [bacterium]
MYKAYAGIVLKDDSLKKNALHILSEGLLTQTAQKLNLITDTTPPAIFKETVDFVGSTINIDLDKDLDLLKIFTVSPNPEHAALIANTHAAVFIENYLGHISDTAREELISFIQREYTVLSASLRSMGNNLQLNKLEKKLTLRLVKAQQEKDRLKKKYSEQHPELIFLSRSIHELQLQLTQISEQKKLLAKTIRTIDSKGSDIASSLPKNDSLQKLARHVLIPAEIPEKPFYPDIQKSFILGISIALLCSIITAVLIEQQYSFSGGFSEIESYVHIPVLAAIAHIERRRKNIAQHIAGFIRLRHRDRLGEQRSRLIVFHPLGSDLVHRYNLILEKLKFKESSGSSILLVTSSGNKEGKTITASNLALSASLAGIKTLLCDMNLRYPVISGLFGIYPQPGLTDIIMQHIPLKDAVKSAQDCQFTTISAHHELLNAGVKNLTFLTAGKPLYNTDALFLKPDIGMILLTLKNEYKLIILDSSSVVHFNDSLSLSKYADKIIFVYRAGRLSRHVLKEAAADVREVSGTIDGLIFNDTKT